MKVKDKKRVDRYRKAYPTRSTGKTDRQVLEIIRNMGKDRNEMNRNFAQFIKTY